MVEHVRAGGAAGRGAGSGGFTVSMRGYLSTQHLWAAEHFTRLAAELEAGHTGEARFSIRHRSYVLGAVGEAVAFLEGFINELFQDATDTTKTCPVPGAAVEAAGTVGRRRAAHGGVLEQHGRGRARPGE